MLLSLWEVHSAVKKKEKKEKKSNISLSEFSSSLNKLLCCWVEVKTSEFLCVFDDSFIKWNVVECPHIIRQLNVWLSSATDETVPLIYYENRNFSNTSPYCDLIKHKALLLISLSKVNYDWILRFHCRFFFRNKRALQNT